MKRRKGSSAWVVVAIALALTQTALPSAGLGIPHPPEVGAMPALDYEDEIEDNTPTLAVRIEGLDASTGNVVVNGSDTGSVIQSFTFDWGDGASEAGWFAMSHTYDDRSRNYLVTVTAHYAGGDSDQKSALVLFVEPAISPQLLLPLELAVVVPDHDVALQTRLCTPPAGLSHFSGNAVGSVTREVVEYVLSAAAWVQYELANGDVFLPDGTFRQVVLRDPPFDGMYSIYCTTPVAFAAGDYAFEGVPEYSSFLHEMGHNFTLNSPAEYHFGGRIDGQANAILTESLAQIFAHVAAYELANNAEEYGLDATTTHAIWESALSSFRVLRQNFEAFVNADCPFSSWNDLATDDVDETLGTFMSLAYVFLREVEVNDVPYREAVKRMMALLQTFDVNLEERYSPHVNSSAAETFRATLMIAAVSSGVGIDLRGVFRGLNFPIDDAIYVELVNRIPADTVLYNMESGHEMAATGLWHYVESSRCVTPGFTSPTHACYFGIDRSCTYAGEGRVQGDLTSVPIDISSLDPGSVLAVSWNQWREVEFYAGGGYDKTVAEVSFDGHNWSEMWYADCAVPSQTSWETVETSANRAGDWPRIPENPQLAWIRFRFDSVDSYRNGYRGWFIDDVQIRVGQKPQCEPVIATACPLQDGYTSKPYEVWLAGQSCCGRQGRWSIEGQLPPGLSWTPDGRISGTPTVAGTWAFQILLEDDCATPGVKACSLTINPCPTAFLFEDFDASGDWHFGDQWHVTDVEECVQCGLLSGARAYYGKDAGADPACNYKAQVPSRAQGDIYSPSVPLPQSVKRLGVEFDSFREVEAYDGAYDRTWVEVSFNAGSTWRAIFYRDSRDASPVCEHVRACCAVPQGASQVQVRFRFDSVDGLFNTFRGWAVDNVAVVDADLAPGFAACGPVTVSIADVTRSEGESISVVNIPNPIEGVDTTTFVVRGLGVEAMRVQIYDLSETLVYEEETTGVELVWHTQNTAGTYLANGVYFYRAWVKIGESWRPTGFEKLVILR